MSDSPASVQRAVEQLERLSVSGDTTASAAATGKSSSQTVDWEEVARLAEKCANSLRTEQARTDLASGTLVRAVASYIVSSSKEPLSTATLVAQTQLCRIVGNLVLDHPANRQICLKNRIPQCIVEVLSTLHSGGQITQELQWIQAVKACTGALLNLSIDTPEIASLLYNVDALEPLGRSLSLYNVGAWTDSASVVRALTAEWTINLIKEILEQEGTTVAAVALPLCKIITDPPLPSTPAFVSSHGSGLDGEQAHTLLSADLSILSAASELLEPRSYSDASLQESIAFGVGGTFTLLQDMTAIIESAEILPAWRPTIEDDKANGDDSLEAEKTFSTFKADVARIVIGVCSNDKVMDEAFKAGSNVHWLLPTCMRWLQSERPDLIITGSTMLANMARKDEYCVTLVQDLELAPILASILNKYTPNSAGQAIGAPGEAVQVLHGIVGLTKNLSIAGPNKQTLCDAGVIQPCLSLLTSSFDMVVPLQNAAIGVLKHLCAGNISSSLKVVLPPSPPGSSSVVSLTPNGQSDPDTSKSPLVDGLSLISRTNDVRLHCEATRLLINIVRSLYSSRSITSPITPSALGGLEMSLAKGKARSIIESNEGVVDAISEIVRTGEKYPILVNEGIVALTLLSTTDSGARFALKCLTDEVQLEAAENAAGASLSAPTSAVVTQANGYHRDRSMSRAVSLNPKNAPARAVDVLVRWLNNYAIAAQDMPAELAANALSLVEGVSRLPSSEQVLPVSEIKKCLEGVVRREANGPNELLLREVAQRNLERLVASS